MGSAEGLVLVGNDERVERLRSRVTAGPNTPAGVRLWAFCQAAREFEGASLVRRRVEGLARTFERFPARIYDDELIVGEHHFGEGPGIDSSIDFPDLGPHLLDTGVEHLRSEVEKTALTSEEREFVLSFAGRRDLFWPRGHAAEPPEDVTLAREAGWIIGGGFDLNHSVRDFAKVMALGFEAIEEQVDERISRLRMDDPEDLSRASFLGAAKTAARACSRLGRKYAAEARRLAEAAESEERRRELLEVAEVCERVPAKPARTLREAIQALWFTHIIACAEDQINANSIGRIDQVLLPYYEADIAAGRLDEAGALELLKHFWLKLWRAYDVQQMQISGRTPQGQDATNPLTYLALQATEELGLVRCLAVRVHSETPRPLIERSVDLLSQGGGVPFFFNDDAIIPALQDKGIPVEDARNYAIIGCVEITIPGKTVPHAVSHITNLCKCVELALNDGIDPLSGKRIGPRTGDPREFAGIEDLWEAYRAHAEHIGRVGAFISNAGQLEQMHVWPQACRSILTEDCIERGVDLHAGGAIYNYHSVCAVGIPNVADSIYAIQRLVFEDQVLTMDELLTALAANFEGYEPVRQMLLNRAEKYGNDHEPVDRWVARVSEHICEYMGSLKTWFGGAFHVHLFSFVWNVDPAGVHTGATPDGRRCGEPMAYSLSATAGRDREGLTAFLNSLARVPHHKAAGSSSAIIELSPSFFEGADRGKLVELVRSGVAAGVGQLQFNVVSAERLIQAQEDPERFGNIIVRVSGFSQEFRLVDPRVQNHIIERTKHTH